MKITDNVFNEIVSLSMDNIKDLMITKQSALINESDRMFHGTNNADIIENLKKQISLLERAIKQKQQMGNFIKDSLEDFNLYKESDIKPEVYQNPIKEESKIVKAYIIPNDAELKFVAGELESIDLKGKQLTEMTVIDGSAYLSNIQPFTDEIFGECNGIRFKDKLELDLIMFGNYLLSEERRSMIQGDPNVVYHADLENWKNKQNNK